MADILQQDAWDSYIKNAGLDPASQIWPSNMDIPINNIMDGQPEQPIQNQQQSNVFGGGDRGGGVFMGVGASAVNNIQM